MFGWTQCAAVHWPQHSSWHLPPSRGQELEMPHPWDAARFWDAKASSLKDVRRLFATTGGWHAVLFVTVHTRTGFCKNTLNNFAAALWKVAVVFFCFHRKQQWVVILSFVNFLFAFGNIRSWVAEPFLKWGGTSARQKTVENFCGLNWQWRHKYWNIAYTPREGLKYTILDKIITKNVWVKLKFK